MRLYGTILSTMASVLIAANLAPVSASAAGLASQSGPEPLIQGTQVGRTRFAPGDTAQGVARISPSMESARSAGNSSASTSMPMSHSSTAAVRLRFPMGSA